MNNSSTASIDIGNVKRSIQGRWTEALGALGVDVTALINRHGPCPICGGKDRFRFDDKDGNGTYYCYGCGPGDGFSLLKLFHRWTFGEALRAVANYISSGNVVSLPKRVSRPDVQKKANEPDPNVAKKLAQQWQDAKPITPDTPPYRYLEKRLYGWCVHMACESEVLRWTEKLPYHEQNSDGEYIKLGTFPALLAQVTSHTGEMVALRQNSRVLVVKHPMGSNADNRPNSKRFNRHNRSRS